MEFKAILVKYLRKLRFFIFKGSRLPVLLSLLATVLTIMLHTTNQPVLSNFMDRLDNLVYDQRFSFMLESPPPTEHTIVIINVDQRSLDHHGQWPWSRFLLGKLVEELLGHGVIVIGFDYFFPEPERNLANELRARMQEQGGSGGDFLPSQEELDQMRDLLDADSYFSEQMSYGDVVLGFSFLPTETSRNGALPRPIIQIDEKLADTLAIQEMKGYTGNVPVLQEGARGAGFFDNLPDVDGVIRRSPLIMHFENELYPSLGLEMARLYYFEENFDLITESDILGEFEQIRGITIGQVFIPTDQFGQVLVPFIGESNLGQGGTYRYISATDVLTGNLSEEDKDALFNSLALVGATATGMFDLRSTPLENIYPGVEVHANILNGILNSAPTFTVDNIDERTQEQTGLRAMLNTLTASQVDPFPSKPDWEDGAVIATLFVAGILLSFIYPYLGPALLLLSSLSFMLGVTALNFKMWGDYNLDISLMIILFLILLITVINLTYGFLKEGLNRRAIKGMFDQYVPPAHIDAMLDDPDNYNFEGESKELSVLFSDIRNFTSISESLSAAQLKTMLNDFFTPITGIIFDYQGTIDKYVGDMVMAFWGAPLDDPEHRTHAVEAALAMLDKVDELKPEFEARGLPEVNIGIGVNSGQMNVGDMGSTYRRSYTVLGDAVNLGSRLEGITKTYGVKLLIGEETYDHLDGFLCRLVDKVQVKGKEESIRIYQPLCRYQDASEELVGLVDEYHRAHKKYVDQDWDEAERMFTNLKKRDPGTMLYDVYLERIENLRGQDLGPDWDGTFRHTSK